MDAVIDGRDLASNPRWIVNAGLVLSSISLSLDWDATKYNDEYGPWFIDTESYLIWEPRSNAQFDLLTCTTSAQVLDWIMHLKDHAFWWVDSRTLDNTDMCTWYIAGLVNLIDEVLHPRKNLCSFGNSKHVTHADVKDLVAEFAASTKFIWHVKSYSAFCSLKSAEDKLREPMIWK